MQGILRLHNSYRGLPGDAKGTVLAIGNLDGLHPGHAALIATARATAARLEAPLGVMTFEPHPRAFFDPQGAPFRLTVLAQKERLLNGMGVGHLFALPFDADFAALTAADFIHTVLADALHVRHVVVGADFAFGMGRKGTVADLQKAADEGLFGLSVIAAVCCDGAQEPYSSSRIRAALAAGDLDKAEDLLGRPWDDRGGRFLAARRCQFRHPPHVPHRPADFRNLYF
jgi:riboflavin kinase/FMN adenylyltransferase